MTLTLYKPEYDDLWFRKLMLEDEETMSFNHAWGGTIPFPKEKWKDWYERWVVNHENKRFYRYVKEKEGTFIGEIAFHYDSKYDGYMANVLIYSKYRNRGYGTVALKMLCDETKEKGIKILFDDIAIDNPAITLFLKAGFVEEYRNEKIILLKKTL